MASEIFVKSNKPNSPKQLLKPMTSQWQLNPRNTFRKIWIKIWKCLHMKIHLNMLFARCCSFCSGLVVLTHWGQVTHKCVSKLTIIGSDNGLAPSRRQAIIWTNAGMLYIGPLGTNFSEISIQILTFSFKKMRLKVWSAKLRPFCLSLNVLK